MLAYIPFAIYQDLKYRAVPENFWKPLYYICIPITGYLYLTRTYIPETLVVSGFCIAAYFALMVYDVIQGADFMYLTAIAAFLVQTPKGDPIAPIAYNLYLIGVVVAIAIFITGTKYGMKKLNIAEENKLAIVKQIEKLQTIPFMVHISLALVLTVVLA